MAIAMRTWGSTLSDLQSGTNADKAIDYQRANAQDAINAQRLESFLRLAGNMSDSRARRNDAAAARANQLKLGEMDARSRLDVAKATAEGRVDPRMFQSFTEIQQLNNDNLNKIKYAEQLSQARRTALAQKNEKMRPEEDTLGWSNKPYAKRVADADALVKQLDTQAATLGLAPSPDGGYVVPSYNPIPLPNFGRSLMSVPINVVPQEMAPQPQVPAMFQGGEVTLGGVPLTRFFDSPPAGTAMIGPSPAPRPRLRFDMNTMDFVP